MGRMTKDEYATREYLADRLAEQGYVTYSELFGLFDLRLTYNPTVLGYMEPGKGRITLNGTLDEHTLCLIIRHEIMHEYLTHEMRAIKHLAQRMGIDEDDIDDLSLADIKHKIYGNDIFNIAGDYEISNRTYTDQDKKDIRNIKLNGQIVSGLVTELDHPDWVDLPMEDMYDLLEKEREEASQEAQQDMNNNADNDEQGDSSDGQQGDRSNGQSSNSEKGQGEQGEGSDGESSNDESDGQEGSGEGDSGEGTGTGSDKQDNKNSQGSGEGQASQGDESNGPSQQGNSKQGGSPDKGGNGKSSGRPDRSQNGSSSKIIHGTFKDGKFYGVDGKEIVPGGK